MIFRRFRVLSFVVALAAAGLAYGQEADLSVTKTGPATAAAGSDVSFSVTVTNFGVDDASNVSLNDPLPAGMTFVSVTQNSGPTFSCNNTVQCTILTLAAGSTATFTIVGHIPPATPPGTTFTNIASVSTSTFDPGDENNSSTAVTSTPPPPSGDMAVTKQGPIGAGPNSDVTYTISLSNGGPDPGTNVALNDTLPGTMTFQSISQTSGPTMSCATPAVGAGGTITCTVGSYAVGATATFTLTGHVPPATPSGTTFSNTATVSSDSDPTAENNSSNTTLTVSSTDPGVTKNGPANAIAGNNIVYTIIVTNGGPDLATNVQLNDPLPAAAKFVSLTQDNGPAATCATPLPGSSGLVSCGFLTMNNGASAQFTLTVSSNSSLTNTATVTSDGSDSNASNNVSSVSTTVTPSSDLSIVKTAPATTSGGSNMTYTVTMANNGPSDATTVVVTDPLPANTTFVSSNQTSGPSFNCTTPAAGANGTITCTIATFTSGASASFAFVVKSTAPGALSNTATVSAATADPSNTNNSSNAATVASADPTDVTVTKSAVGLFIQSQPAVYSIVAANSGPATAFGVVVTDILPAGTTFISATSTQGSCTGGATVTCNVGTLAPGASATVTLSLTLPGSTVPISNTATVSSTNVDTAPASNTSAITTSVLASALGIPTLSPMLLACLAAAFVAVAAGVLRRM